MKGNPKMISTDTHQQFNRALKPAIMKQFPEPRLNSTTIDQLGAGQAPIEVFPPEIFFKDIEPNQNYEVTVTVRNLTKNMKRIKFSQPQTQNFRCHYENFGSVAAGLSVKLNVQFECKQEGDFHDMVEVHCEGHPTPYKLQLHAMKPAPDIQFEPIVNMTCVAAGQQRVETVYFRNEGRVAGYFNLEEVAPKKPQLVIEPAMLHISPNETVGVQIGVTGVAGEMAPKKIKVTVNGQEDRPARYIDVTTTSADQNISLVFEEGGGPKSSLNFGTVYMGERKEFPAMLINNGPLPAAFNFKFLQGLRNLEDDVAAEQDNFVSPAEVGKELTDRVLTTFPLSGVVGPYQQIPIQFVCRTKKHERQGGFADLITKDDAGDAASQPGESRAPTGQTNMRSQANVSDRKASTVHALQEVEKFQVRPEDYATLAILKFGEPTSANSLDGNGAKHADIKVQMMARAVYPDLKLNKQVFSFGEVACNDRRDMTLTIKNKSKDLMLDFNFSKVANFKCVPAKGKLFPDSEHHINISFEPHAMGMFQSETFLEVLKGMYKIPLKLSGNCRAKTEKEKLVRGPAARVQDFEPNLKLTTDEDAAVTTLEETIKRKQPKGDRALNKLDDQQIQDREDNVKAYLAIKANKERFNNFVKHERVDRAIDNRIQQKVKETRRAPPMTLEEMEKDVDLGINYKMAHPKMERVTDHVDPLYVERPIDKYEPAFNLDRLRQKREQTNADRIIKKKFKQEPTTQTEIKDCSVELTGEQLQKISAGPQRINFKNVFVKSQSTKSFIVTNDLRHNIYVRLMVDQYPELQLSTPLSQVIPPGQEAGFDIVFCSQQVKSFSAPITYFINDRPFNFLVTAQADPVSLELSKKHMRFSFSDDSMDMSVQQTLLLTNYGNAAARFEWKVLGTQFKPEPMTDEVAAYSTKNVVITFNPSGPKADEETMYLKIQDGETEELKCSGAVTEAKCAFIEKQLDFGNVHVGIAAKDRTIQIKNQLRSPAIFHVQQPEKGLSIHPMQGKITGDQRYAFKVSFESAVPRDFKTDVVVNIRGGKPLRIPVTANAIVPEVFIDEKMLDFGPVTFGDQKELALTIVNNSDITAKLILDIRDFPEFDIILPEPAADDDVHSEIMVPMDDEQPKYDDIMNNMKDDDIDPIGDQEEEEDDDDQYDEDAKRHVKLSIRSTGQPFCMKLKYTPQGVEDPKNFILPLQLMGHGEIPGLKRRIKAVGEKPRFFLEPTVVNFKTKVIAKGQKPLPFHQDITISNPDMNPVAWRIDRDQIDQSKVFQMNPYEGVLDPNSTSTVRVTFNPHEPIEYVVRIPLYLDDEKEKPYLMIEFRGEGADAKIYFDRREIILPPVPLNIETKATFLVCHNGYENQELRYKIANEVGKIPIRIMFPDGNNLGVTKQKVKVEASFIFTSPLSFTTFIDFFDDEGNKFSIPISGTTDNSIFTCFSFLQRFYDEIVYRADQGKPIILEQNASSDLESNKTGFPGAGKALSKGASSVISRTARSLVGYNPVRGDILERNCEFICRWFNASLSNCQMQAFPQDVVHQNGNQVFELIAYLSGKRPPGQATAKQIATANQNNAKDALKVLLNQYEELINFLKVNGAHLNTIRPEYLLHTTDYTKFLKMNPKEENMKPKIVDKIFPFIAMESWITIFYQILRIYYLNRITPKNFKALPGVPNSENQVDNSMQKSNCYSVAEAILLKWMQYHCNLVTPMYQRTLTNFDHDLMDSSVFACLIKSHYGETPSLAKFKFATSNTDEQLSNARMIIKSLDEIGISTHLKAEDVVEPSARELLLFCIQLYQSLPHYVPKAQIEFPAVLGDLVTKNIELSNPSKNPISYWVKLIGSSDFSIETDQVRIEPGHTIAFPIRFQSRISNQVKGKVIFTNKKEGNIQAAAMVFELVSNVYERNSVDIIQKSTKLYKALQIDLSVENAFQQDVLFNISIQYERSQKDKNKDKGKDGKKGAAAAGPGGRKQVEKAGSSQNIGGGKQQTVPDPYFCKLEQVKIRKGAQVTVPILFLPFELGIHKAHIIFTDENVGEVQYTIIGKSELPEILDTFSGDCNAEEPFTFKKLLNFKNDKLEQARNQIHEQSKKSNPKTKTGIDDATSQPSNPDIRKARQSESTVAPGGAGAAAGAAAAAVKEVDTSKLFEIEISNPFFSGPSNITLVDLAAPKANAAQGGKGSGKEGKNAMSVNDYNPMQNIMELNCNPSKPASYTCYVILKSLDRTDIRLYEYKLTAIPQKIKAQLEFRVPARGHVIQDIPIVNNSSQEWKVQAILEMPRGGAFSIVGLQTKVVKKDHTELFQLKFSPTWVCETTGTLTLKNESTKEEYEYELKGIGEEPLAEDHIILNCKAREKNCHVFNIENKGDKPVNYTVWTDLQNAVGTKEFTVAPRSTYDYDLAVTPLLGGVYTASITFQDTDERFIWWTVEVRTDSPRPEGGHDMRACIRKATSAEFSLSNPLNEPITFEVFYQGEGLLGDPTFSLEPKSVQSYTLIFSPLQAGETMGNIGFLNEKVGEFWYDLKLIAEENPVQNMPMLECELGKMASHTVELENPTAKEILLDFKNTNPTNFEVSPDKLILPPYEAVKVQIQYSPTSLDVVESGQIVFENPLVGKWEFNVEGKGLVPTIMEPQPISTSVGNSTSSMLSFKNPFKEPSQVTVHLESSEPKIFSMLLKRNKFKVGPLGMLQIPYSFSPETMTESKATIVVSMYKQLVWKYPLRGIAESASTSIDYHFRTRARMPFEESLKIFLPGFKVANLDDTFHHELKVSSVTAGSVNQSHNSGPGMQGLIDRSVFFDQRTAMLQNQDDPLQFDLRFEPLRPFKTTVEFIIYKSSGGRWKFNMVFEALEPEVDDSILIQSPLQKTSSVSFRLSNHLKAMAEFQAYFTPDSAGEFVVYPKSGLLEPYGKEGTNFIVSFTPTEYGKMKMGKLVIQTEEMQWTYEIKGTHPQYKIPSVQGGRIENKLSKEVLNKQMAGQAPKNFLRENQRANAFVQKGSISPGKDRPSGLRRGGSQTKREKSARSRSNSPGRGQ